jgi:hypothetical protein
MISFIQLEAKIFTKYEFLSQIIPSPAQSREPKFQSLPHHLTHFTNLICKSNIKLLRGLTNSYNGQILLLFTNYTKLYYTEHCKVMQ